MDGLAKSGELVFVLCVSNLPWTLDTALLRRLEKRIFVPLPSKQVIFESGTLGLKYRRLDIKSLKHYWDL